MSNTSDFVIDYARVLQQYTGDATDVVIPDTVREIGEMPFFRQKITSVVIPASVEKIGNHAFEECRSLKSIVLQGTTATITASTITECTSLESISFPENYFVRTVRCSAVVIPYMRQLSIKEKAYIWMFQDDKWFAWLNQSDPDMNELAVAIMDIIKNSEKLTPKLVTRLVDLIRLGYPEITCKNVKKICDIVSEKDEKTAKKFLKENVVQKGLSNERTTEETEPIELYAESLLEKKPLHPEATIFAKGVSYKGKEKLCTPELLNILVSEYLYVYDQYQTLVSGEFGSIIKLEVPDNTVIPSEPDKIAAELDADELSLALESLVNSCSKKYRPWMYAYARFATEASVKTLIQHPPKGSPAKVRNWRENFEEALMFSDTKSAVDYIEKKGKLVKYAKIRGMTVQEFRDQYSLPKWNIDSAGVITSACGRFTYTLTPDFTFKIKDTEKGKDIRTISAKSAPEATQEFKNIKQEATSFFKKRIEYIRNIYITKEQLDLQSWSNTYCLNPILTPVTEKVIWQDETKESFMCVQGKTIRFDGSEYTPKGLISVAHVLDMSDEQIRGWQEYLQLNGIKLLIEQVWEPITAVKNLQIFEGMILSKEDRSEFKRILGHKGITVKSETDYIEFDHRSYRYEFSNSATMHVGDSLEIDYVVDEDTGETTLKTLKHSVKYLMGNNSGCLARELNTILFELCRASVKSAIRQDSDQLSTWISSSKFTAAQILEFIRIAQESNATNVTALLLDYQNKHFADFDPTVEFILE